jgi:PKD repeat protein
VSVSDQFNLSTSTVADDGASATFQLVDLSESVNPGDSDVTLATVTVESSSDDPALSVTNDNIDDDDGEAVSVSSLSIGGSAAAGDLMLAGNTINDLDGDGTYEDLNGDGEFTFLDVITLVFEFESVQDPALTDALDFDGQNGLTFADVIDLVFQLPS